MNRRVSTKGIPQVKMTRISGKAEDKTGKDVKRDTAFELELCDKSADAAAPSASPEDRPSVGLIIATLRRQSGLTQDQLGAALGVGRGAVAQWETNRGGETLHIERIAKVLGTPVEVFLTGMVSHRFPEQLSLDELDVVRLYRSLNVSERLVALRMLRSFPHN